MKNLLFLSIITFFVLININAQNIKYGSKIGLNIANITGDDTKDLTTRTSLHAGVIAEILISDNFAFQPELLYSAQGYKSDKTEIIDGIVNRNKLDAKLDYLNVPLLIKYYPVKGISLEAGPQVGFLLTADGEFEETVNGETETGSEEIKDQLKELDIGLKFGVGYKHNSGVIIAAHYNLGLTDINDIEGESNLKNQNEVVQISLGYFF